jgi:hypothetical protein
LQKKERAAKTLQPVQKGEEDAENQNACKQQHSEETAVIVVALAIT